MTSDANSSKTTKGERTRELIFDTAVQLFQKNGYEQTTMRDVAAACGVALGNTYYYFDSKEHLVFRLYERTLAEQAAESAKVLQRHNGFKTRLAEVMHSTLNVLSPYHSVFRALLRSALDPDSSLNPFGKQSSPLRIAATSVFKDVIDGSKENFPNELRKELPFLLWLYSMGIIFYWLNDRSPNHEQAHRLIDLTCQILSQVLALSNLPLMDKLWLRVHSLVVEFVPSEE